MKKKLGSIDQSHISLPNIDALKRSQSEHKLFLNQSLPVKTCHNIEWWNMKWKKF